ncbi:NUDIX hydrolase [Aliifodinibius sp. S!AR15-10]|uniref:NUDIX hydrolase n=1 Tax=Aliifodinibius sp. S!AR15-10 TaxID=2950437 RepID=UPI00285F2C40|nr:NUDIX hydrolase [Aliifodinibius sp. S!AR15-10]MDR8389796.1 NUDIX hydrolase [Aliifodinibius sp. S!AR15-10]
MPESTYRERLRIRVNGLLIDDEAMLMVKLRSPVTDSGIWMPPGGGLKYGETMEACLAREFREETGLRIEVGALRHINEFLNPPFHAVEFYFEVTAAGGELALGNDPEHTSDSQLLQKLKFIELEEFSSYPIMPEYLYTQFLREQKEGKKGISFSGK